MKIKKNIILLIFILLLLNISCKDNNSLAEDIPTESELYFPPTDGSQWESTNLSTFNWNENELENLFNYLSTNNTRAFIVLKNEKNSIIPPGLSTSFNMELSSQAPDDLFAGMGKNGQFVDVVPSQKLVVIRMGEAPDDSLVPIEFHNEMWEKLNLVINE